MDFNTMSLITLLIGLVVGAVIVGIVTVVLGASARNKADKLLKDAQKEAERHKRDALAELKEESYKLKQETEKEIKEKKADILASEERLLSREKSLDKREEMLQNRDSLLEQKDNNLSALQKQVQEKENKMDELLKEELEKLETISKFSKERAHDEIMKRVESNMEVEIAEYIKEKEAEAKFKEISEAYEVLSDKQKRQMYDQFGHNGPQGFGGNGGGYYSYGSGFDGFSGFSGFDDFGFGSFGDIFSAAFGGGTRRKSGPRKGADLKVSLEITFEESYLGTEKTINLSRNKECSHCHGTGAKPGTNPETCQVCNGTGKIKQVVTTPFGQMSTQKVCSNCGGEGKIIKEACSECKGKGYVRESAKIKVKIPAGIGDEQTIVLRGEGEPGTKNGPKGDLYINVHVKKHSILWEILIF